MYLTKLLLFNLVVWASFVCIAGRECDGTPKSEKITGTPLKYIYLPRGNRANLIWTWCIAVNSSVTGIVIFRSSPRNRKQTSPVLTMDLSKNVYYQKDKSRHELSSILNKTKFQEKTVFTINNVSIADSGAYSLCVRREGIRDLQSEDVGVIVKITDPTNKLRFTIPTAEGTITASPNNTIHKRKVEKDVHSLPWYVILLGVVFSTLFVVALVVVIVFMIRRKKSSNGTREILINENESGKPLTESHSYHM